MTENLKGSLRQCWPQLGSGLCGSAYRVSEEPTIILYGSAMLEGVVASED